MTDFKMPSLGADMDEGTLLEWNIQPGDQVTRGQIVAVVDTSKAAVDIESWQEGTVEALLAEPGQTIPVGQVIARFLAPGEPPSPTAVPEAAPAAAPIPTRAATETGVESEATSNSETPPTSPAAPPPPAPAAAAAAVPAASRQRVSPAARRRAAELNVALETLGSGSGPHGAISVADVERAEQRQAPTPTVTRPAPAGAAAATTRERMAERAIEMRRTIAAAMSRSKREIPHYYLTESIPMRHLSDWLAAENGRRPMARRLLMAVPLLKAVAVTIRRFPELNGWYRDGEYTPAEAVHLGVAIALRQGGLVAPAIHDVADRSLDDLMAALGDLIQRTRAGKLRSSELSDATVTVTSLGEQGVETVQGVIYPPQVAIVGLGRIAERPWAEDGALSAIPVMTASLAADHRVSDGHRGGRFLAALRDLLQHPEQLLETT